MKCDGTAAGRVDDDNDVDNEVDQDEGSGPMDVEFPRTDTTADLLCDSFTIEDRFSEESAADAYDSEVITELTPASYIVIQAT